MVNISKSKIAADIPVAERAVSRRRNLSDVLSDEDFIPKSSLSPGEIADGIVLHVSCQVQQVPHIPSIAASIAARIGVSVTMVGGAEFCCGAYHRHAGDIDFENQIATASLKGIGRSGAREFVSLSHWRPKAWLFKSRWVTPDIYFPALIWKVWARLTPASLT